MAASGDGEKGPTPVRFHLEDGIVRDLLTGAIVPQDQRRAGDHPRIHSFAQYANGVGVLTVDIHQAQDGLVWRYRASR